MSLSSRKSWYLQELTVGMYPSSSAADNGPSGLLSLKALLSIMHQSSFLQLRKTKVAMKAVEEHPSQQEWFLQMLINGEKDKYVTCDKRQGLQEGRTSSPGGGYQVCF